MTNSKNASIAVIFSLLVIGSIYAQETVIDQSRNLEELQSVIAMSSVQARRNSDGILTGAEFTVSNISNKAIIAWVPVFHLTFADSGPCRDKQQHSELVHGGVYISDEKPILLPGEILSHMANIPVFKCNGVPMQGELDAHIATVVFEDWSHINAPLEMIQYLRALRTGSISEHYLLRRVLKQKGVEALINELERDIRNH